MLKKREKRAKRRIENAKKSTELAGAFFDKGFTSLIAMVAIAQNYYPDMTVVEINNFWHFRNVSDEMIFKMESILEQLKNE